MRDELWSRLSDHFAFDSSTRLHRLEAEGELGELHVEAWSLREALDAPWQLDIVALALRADLDIDAMTGRPVTLCTRLADGSEVARGGIVMGVTAEDSDGGWARLRLEVRPWLQLLALTRRSQVWTERSVVEIVESVFGAHAGSAAWRWSPCVAEHLAASHNAGLRSYTVQYRESDLDFVLRILAREAIALRFEPHAAAPLGHRIVFFADSPSAAACPEDITSRAGSSGDPGIRFHREAQVEAQDSIQALGGVRQLLSAGVTALAWDYAAKRAIAGSVATGADVAGPNAPRLESYEPLAPYPFADTTEADRAARLVQEALEVRHKRWLGRGTVRSFTAGTTFTLTRGTLDLLDLFGPDDAPSGRNRFLLTEVTHAGLNNLPKDIAGRIGQVLDHSGAELLSPWVDPEVRAQAARSGYGNGFRAVRTHVPWRPMLEGEGGVRLHPRPTAPGPLTATVVGPRGERSASGADEIHMDALGRIKVQYDFQRVPQGDATGVATSITSTWVRVLQRYAGAGMGLQFIPRIGQEVLVDFIDRDMERPVVVAALYNGRGEGGVPATPGGRAAAADTRVFTQADDATPSGQANLAGGHSPAWHGASADHAGHRNASALSGVKTQEFGGEGFNQLVLDDTDAQSRVQLATTQHGSQLNLGHLIHQADNFRGSFRGLGWELRTDAYGAIRAGNGVLISSYGTDPSEPAGDNAAGIALALQQLTLAQVFSDTAMTHEVVQLPGHIGSYQRDGSSLDAALAPLKALHRALRGMVDERTAEAAATDAADKRTTTADDKVPHPTDPIVAITARAGLAVVAGQDIHLTAGEMASLASGQDTQWAIGGALRVHTGQSIGMLAGAVKPGEEAAGKGLTLIAGQGEVKVQAQAGAMQIAAKDDVNIESALTHIDWAAAKRIVISTAGGASLTMEGGNMTFACPGTMTIHASAKRFVGPEVTSYAMPHMPRGELQPHEVEFRYVDYWNRPVEAASYVARFADGSAQKGRLDGAGYKVTPGTSPADLLSVTYTDNRPLEHEATVEVVADWHAALKHRSNRAFDVEQLFNSGDAA